MYIPKLFEVKDFEEVRSFIETYSFATVVSVLDGKPVATHLPIQVHVEEEQFIVSGHFAKANPQWQSLEQCESLLIIIQGPHSYVSSSWYSFENVSTWNYEAVHLYGKPSFITEEELVKDLAKLQNKYEQQRPNAVTWDTLSEQTKAQLKGVVGFKVNVTEIQAAYKMSQNRKPHDYEAVIEGLQQEGTAEATQVAKEMQRLKVNK